MKTKKIMPKMLISLSLVGLLMSCSTSNEVVSNSIFQKRKYKKGWYVNTGDKVAQKSITKENENTNVFVYEKEDTNYNLIISKDVKSVEKELNTKKNETFISKEYLKENTNSLKNKNDKLLLASNNEKDVLTVLNPLNIVKHSIQTVNKQKEVIQKSQNKSGGIKILLIILAFFIPFLASGIATGWKDLIWLYTLLWTLLFFLPGLIHAIIVISKN